MPLPRPVALLLVVAILCLIPFSLAAQPATRGSDAPELAGLWEANVMFQVQHKMVPEFVLPAVVNAKP